MTGKRDKRRRKGEGRATVEDNGVAEW